MLQTNPGPQAKRRRSLDLTMDSTYGSSCSNTTSTHLEDSPFNVAEPFINTTGWLYQIGAKPQPKRIRTQDYAIDSTYNLGDNFPVSPRLEDLYNLDKESVNVEDSISQVIVGPQPKRMNQDFINGSTYGYCDSPEPLACIEHSCNVDEHLFNANFWPKTFGPEVQRIKSQDSAVDLPYGSYDSSDNTHTSFREPPYTTISLPSEFFQHSMSPNLPNLGGSLDLCFPQDKVQRSLSNTPFQQSILPKFNLGSAVDPIALEEVPNVHPGDFLILYRKKCLCLCMLVMCANVF